MKKAGKPAKKYSQAARLHDVIRILEARYGATVDDLVEECGVTRRTVYRDLNAIREAGYPLVSEPDVGGKTVYRFIAGFKKIPPITFSLEELMTLYLCRGQLDFLQGTPFQDDLNAIFGRIRSSLPPRSVAHLERIAKTVSPKFLGQKDYAAIKELLKELRRAVLYQFRLLLDYTPARRSKETYEMDPYTLIFYEDALYLAGYVHDRKALRLFLIDRIDNLHVLDTRFEVPESFTASDLTGNAFGLIDEGVYTVKILFSPEVRHLISERTWHPSQKLSETSDGSIILSFVASGEKEILSWIYSYIPYVQVLEPEELKAKFYTGLETVLSQRENQ